MSCINSAEIARGSMICYLALALFILKALNKDQPLKISKGILAPTQAYLPCKLLFKHFFYVLFMYLYQIFNLFGGAI